MKSPALPKYPCLTQAAILGQAPFQMKESSLLQGWHTLIAAYVDSELGGSKKAKIPIAAHVEYLPDGEGWMVPVRVRSFAHYSQAGVPLWGQNVRELAEFVSSLLVEDQQQALDLLRWLCSLFQGKGKQSKQLEPEQLRDFFACDGSVEEDDFSPAIEPQGKPYAFCWKASGSRACPSLTGCLLKRNENGSAQCLLRLVLKASGEAALFRPSGWHKYIEETNPLKRQSIAIDAAQVDCRLEDIPKGWPLNPLVVQGIQKAKADPSIHQKLAEILLYAGSTTLMAQIGQMCKDQQA